MPWRGCRSALFRAVTQYDSSLDADRRKWSKLKVISPIAVPSPGDSDPVGCGILIYSVYG